jgi:hypothetical protein
VRVLVSEFCGGVGFLWNCVVLTIWLSGWLAYNACFWVCLCCRGPRFPYLAGTVHFCDLA